METHIKIGNSFELIKEEPDNKFDCVVTSPPYWGLRDYGTPPVIFDEIEGCTHEWEIIERKMHNGRGDSQKSGKFSEQEPIPDFNIESGFCSKCGAWRGQLGLEPTPELYLQHLWQLFDDIKLKLKDTGTCWVNLGDTYWGGGNASGHTVDTVQFGSVHTLERNHVTKPVAKGKGFKDKCLCMIPERFAWGMVERGWILRNKPIWHKPNHMPESVEDRLTKSYENVYFFTKNGKYDFNLDAIRVDSITKDKREYGIIRGKTLNYNSKFGKNIAFYGGKYEGNKLHESFGSPRARTQRKHKIGDGYRQGMNRDESAISIQRVHDVNQKEIAEFLKEHLKQFVGADSAVLDNTFGVHKWRHWIRTDESGACLPSPDDWKILKELAPWMPDYYDLVMLETTEVSQQVEAHPKGKNPGDVWQINTQPYPEAHFAVFPLELVRIPILAGSPEGGHVLDPFGGSGTVAEYCLKHNRECTIYELNKNYKSFIIKRTYDDFKKLDKWV